MTTPPVKTSGVLNTFSGKFNTQIMHIWSVGVARFFNHQTVPSYPRTKCYTFRSPFFYEYCLFSGYFSTLNFKRILHSANHPLIGGGSFVRFKTFSWVLLICSVLFLFNDIDVSSIIFDKDSTINIQDRAFASIGITITIKNNLPQKKKFNL